MIIYLCSDWMIIFYTVSGWLLILYEDSDSVMILYLVSELSDEPIPGSRLSDGSMDSDSVVII
jgi:hypothetical protein